MRIDDREKLYSYNAFSLSDIMSVYGAGAAEYEYEYAITGLGMKKLGKPQKSYFFSGRI